MAQFYNNAIEHEIEKQLKQLKTARINTKILISNCVDDYIYKGKRLDFNEFSKQMIPFFDFNAYEGKAFVKQAEVNNKQLIKQLPEEIEITNPNITAETESINKFKLNYQAQVDQYVKEAFQMYLNYCIKFDQTMQRRINEAKEDNEQPLGV